MPETERRPAQAPEPSPAAGHVVVGVDGSAHSLRALDRAAEEARLRGAALHVLCGGQPPRRSVVPETDADREHARAAAAQVADAAAQRARSRVPGLDVTAAGVTEPAPDALVRAGKTAVLTVVGTRGHGGFRGLLVGSVSLRLAAHAAGPLMVVRGEEPAEPVGETVVGLKWVGATEPVGFAFEQAERDGSAVRVVHAWMYPVVPGIALTLSPKEPSEESRRAEEFLRETVAPFRTARPGVAVRTEQHRGSTAERLIKLSEGARLIVLGVRREQRRLGLQVGPVVHELLQHARCAVVLVPVP